MMTFGGKQFNMDAHSSLLGSAAAIIILTILRRQRRRRKRRRNRQWVREWILRRDQHGAYQALLKELQLSDQASFKNFLRMDVSSFEEILTKVGPLISKQDTTLRQAIPPGERLALTLRYLATGETYTSLQYLYRVPKQTISIIIPEVCEAIFETLHEDYLQVPGTETEWKLKAEEFGKRWNFPNCLGAIDGKHIMIRPPANSGSYFFNYKGSFSIVLMAIVDADYKFSYVDVGCNGRISDGGVFKNCSLYSMLEENNLGIKEKYRIPGTEVDVNFAFVADDAFPLKTYILKPYSQRNLSNERRIFNYRLSRARRIVENVFGILANRFRVFMQPIALEPRKVESIVMACCTLHNFLRSKVSSSAIYMPPGYIDYENPETGELQPGDWRQGPDTQGLLPSPRSVSGRAQDEAKDARDNLCEYFNSPDGAVPWQWKMTGLDRVNGAEGHPRAYRKQQSGPNLVS